MSFSLDYERERERERERAVKELIAPVILKHSDMSRIEYSFVLLNELWLLPFTLDKLNIENSKEKKIQPYLSYLGTLRPEGARKWGNV